MRNPILHRDGTISYFSIYSQTWRERVVAIPDEELAAMTAPDRERVGSHLAEEV